MKVDQILERRNVETVKIELEIPVGCEAATIVPKLLYNLKQMGDMGCSRGIKIEDWDGDSSFGFDGDGSDKILTLKVNGEEFKYSKPKAE